MFTYLDNLIVFLSGRNWVGERKFVDLDGVAYNFGSVRVSHNFCGGN